MAVETVSEDLSTVMTLSEYITRHLRVPFFWGKHDCVLFALGWVRISSGVDHLAGYPVWKSERQARRIVRDGGGLEALLDKHFDRINPHLAADGALALRDDCLCLFSGAHIVGAGPDGLTFVKRTEATCAWRY
jgi:hypothetical protein